MTCQAAEILGLENELCYSRNKNQATKLFLRLNFGNDLIFVLKSNNSQFFNVLK